MSQEVTAVLINVTSIQEYIYHSNKLKENIGASYIIEHKLYNELMRDILKKKPFGVSDIDLWKKDYEVKINTNPKISCEVGYIGGGNTLLLFNSESNATQFIKEFSRETLLRFPGLRLLFGLKNNFNTDDYQNQFRSLMTDLKTRKASFIPVINVPKHGITADCPWSNDSAEVEIQSGRNNIFISMSSKVKIDVTTESLKSSILEELYEISNDGYTLTDDIEKLGQENESSYIAVVHIDGNGMGKIFSNISSFLEVRKKSSEVSSKAKEAMKKLIEQIIMDIEQIKYKDLDLKKESGKTILPIRPILVGGDDITFLCEGKLGVYLAEKFIKFFYNAEDNLMDGACAGVAIVKTHFPFYKAVKLAEELCAEAKKPTRGNGNAGSYISFYYSATTFSGTLEELRERTHRTKFGKELYNGPYLLISSDDSNSIKSLKNGIKSFNKKRQKNKNQWANNKIMKLRDVLMESEETHMLFLKELNEINLKLPTLNGQIWNENKTQLFDQIELMDFYLEELIDTTHDEVNA
ncbi:MAG: hypothetical protein WBO44_06360 [Saprospiraceae bacterium]